MDSFAENLDEGIEVYLTELWNKLSVIITQVTDVHCRNAALSALSSTAMAAEDKIQPFFESMIKTTAPWGKDVNETTRSQALMCIG